VAEEEKLQLSTAGGRRGLGQKETQSEGTLGQRKRKGGWKLEVSQYSDQSVTTRAHLGKKISPAGAPTCWWLLRSEASGIRSCSELVDYKHKNRKIEQT
jgi:hypothetical protein